MQVHILEHGADNSCIAQHRSFTHTPMPLLSREVALANAH